MSRIAAIPALLLLLGLILGDAPVDPIVSLAPPMPDSVSYDLHRLVILSASKEAVPSLCVSTQWEKTRVFDLSADLARENFAKDFFRFVPPGVTLELVDYSFRYFKGYSIPDSLKFSFSDSVTLRKLWQAPAFVSLVKEVGQASEASEVVLTARGWIDSTYGSQWDDPNSDTRTLYKLHVQLIPGVNSIYFSAPGMRSKAMSFRTTAVLESKPTTDRSFRFHNSPAEQGCTTCHEGLPSADSGATMKADCNTCHQEFAMASFLHAPVEMKECSSCHSWSADKHAVVVESAVPGTCYTCHAEKQSQVDSSQSAHPVAGDCLTCHSQHGSDQKHLLKADTYSLCTSCHEDQKVNHPVGRHPLRFARLRNGDEISCTSCHNPHGSPNEHLLRSSGGRMGVCIECH